MDLFVHNHEIYIEEDTSNQPIAESLLAAGIPKEDSVLAFHASDKRRYTEFALARRVSIIVWRQDQG